MTYSSSGAEPHVNAAPGDAVPDAAQRRFIARIRAMMLISGATTVLAVAAVLGVIGYRVLHQEGSAATPDVTVLVPRGAKIVGTSVAGDRIAVVLDLNGAVEVRTYDVKTLRLTGTLKFATEP